MKKQQGRLRDNLVSGWKDFKEVAPQESPIWTNTEGDEGMSSVNICKKILSSSHFLLLVLLFFINVIFGLACNLSISLASLSF